MPSISTGRRVPAWGSGHFVPKPGYLASLPSFPFAGAGGIFLRGLLSRLIHLLPDGRGAHRLGPGQQFFHRRLVCLGPGRVQPLLGGPVIDLHRGAVAHPAGRVGL